MPGLANFPGEFLSLLGAFERSALLGSFATLSVVAAGVYGVNMYQRLYQVDAQEDVREVNRLELVALTPLVLGILWFGLFPQPQLARIETQAVRAPAFDAPAVAAPVSLAPSASPGLESPEGDEGGH